MFNAKLQAAGRVRPFALPDLVRRGWGIDPPLMLFVAAMAVTTVVCAAGIALDPRLIQGAPAWVKPTKFALSMGVYGATFLWMLRYVTGHPRLVRLVARSIALIFTVELAIIVVQTVRGRMSHFNFVTPLDAALYMTVAYTIVVVWLMNLLLMVLLLRQRLPDAALAWGLRLGLLISLVGMSEGMLMTSPTAAQLAAQAAGQPLTFIGAHAVGAAEDGPGLPFLGWSTTGGDLRIAHFFGLHGLQALPLLGWLVSRWRVDWLGPRPRALLVAIGGLSYLGLVGLLTWQALRAQPLLAPDATTLAALAAVIGATALATGGVLLAAWRGSSRIVAAQG